MFSVSVIKFLVCTQTPTHDGSSNALHKFFVKLPNNILSHSRTRASQKYLKTTKFTQFKPLDPFLAKINSCFRYVAFTGKGNMWWA